MGDYTKAGKSGIIRDQGALIGSTLNTLSTFLINTWAQLETIGRGTGSQKAQFINRTVYPAIALIGTALMTTGWSGLPGVQDYDNLVRKLNDLMHLDLPTSFMLQQHFGKDVFGKQANNAYYGAAAEQSGRDIFKSARAGSMGSFGGFLAGGIADVGKEAYTESKNLLSKTGLVNPPSEMELYKTRRAVTPPNFQFFVENAAGKLKPSGDLVLKEGILRKASELPADWHNPFQSLDEKKQRDINAAINYLQARQTDRQKRVLTLMGDAVDQGKPVAPLFKQLVDVNPDFAKSSDAVVQHLVEDAIKRRLTQGEFDALKAAKGTSLNDMQMQQKRQQFNKQLLGAK